MKNAKVVALRLILGRTMSFFFSATFVMTLFDLVEGLLTLKNEVEPILNDPGKNKSKTGRAKTTQNAPKLKKGARLE